MFLFRLRTGSAVLLEDIKVVEWLVMISVYCVIASRGGCGSFPVGLLGI